MKLIESKAELILQQEGLEGVYKQIEFCGRTCYKSEDKITEDSAKGFVERMIKSNHTAMLEQGTVYLDLPNSARNFNAAPSYALNQYSRLIVFQGKDRLHNYVTTNYRVLVENGWLEDLKYICEPTQYHEKRYTMKFTTDRGVMAELTRHRAFSFSIESTRYCNYSKSKFGNEVTFIKPSWTDSIEIGNYFIKHDYEKGTYSANFGYVGYPQDYLTSLCEAENAYFEMLNKGCTPQQARQVLPNALKTEVCMTGFASDWRYFFDLRYYGETGKPHPDMELLASKARSEFMKAGLWDNIMACPTKFDKDDTEGKD